MVNEILLAIYAFALIFTTSVIFFCYQKIRQASREYSKAKTVLDDIILSFNRDLQSQDEKIGNVAEKIEKTSAKNWQAIEEINSKILKVTSRLDDVINVEEGILKDYDTLKKNFDNKTAQRIEMREKLDRLESLGKTFETPEVATEPAIPIKRERALAPLTDTELKILELLAKDGEKTAPQIRDGIKLTREHTARLMKNLYARGYVERRTNKIPYVYRLKREMENLLNN